MKHDLRNRIHFHMDRMQTLLSESTSTIPFNSSHNEHERSITFNKKANPLNLLCDMDVSEHTLIEELVKLGNNLKYYSLNDINTSDLSDCSSSNLKGKTRDSEY